MTYKDLIKQQMINLPPKSVIIGYNTKYGSKGYGTFEDCEWKCIETPIAENLMVGMAMGMALEGYLPIVWFERHDFLLNALDAIVNHLDKIERLSRGEFNPKVIIRACVGAKEPIYPGIQHTQDYSHAIDQMIRNMNLFMYQDKRFIDTIWRRALLDEKSSIIIEWKEKYDS